ncbi:MAG: hypothetical protein JOZ41_08780 [Chloroflexi bacterium]|nr:hypothetical protein [Chloroflexota bacterium]
MTLLQRRRTTLLPALLLVVSATLAGSLPIRAAAVRAANSSSLYLRPAGTYQTRTFFVPGNRTECRAIARAHPGLSDRRCYLSVMVELRTRGVQPIITARRRLPGGRLGYASITACLSGTTMGGRGNCYRTVQLCPFGSSTRPACYPAWDARVSTEFEFNGRAVLRTWLDPGLVTGFGFVVQPSRAFSLPKSARGPKGLPIGEDLSVTGSIPATRGVRVAHVLRMTVFPNGGVRYSVR